MFRDLLAVDLPHRGRREFKYVLPHVGGERAVSWVTSRARALRREYPARQVTSIYFDSASYTCYRQSNAGESERVKVRLRWYGALDASSPLTLELKHRANHLGWKSQYTLGVPDLPDRDLRTLPALFAQAVVPTERPVVEHLRIPVLVTSYFRHYFVTTDGDIRVTVDTGLRYLDQRLRPALNLTRDTLPCDFAVVECKLEQAREHQAGHLLRAFSPRHARFSKYCHGLQCLTDR